MTYEYDKEKNVINISDVNSSIALPIDDLRNINDLVNREIYFKDDVSYFLQEKAEDGEIEESMLDNQEYLDDILSEYQVLRDKYDGDAEGLTWKQCLEEAFKKCPVEDYEHDSIEK